MIPLELLDEIVPPRGCVLIRRDERPVTARGIIVPDRARLSTRAAMATVVRTAPDVREVAPGDRVLLAATVGSRQIKLGSRDELLLEICKPSQILCLVEGDGLAENKGEHALRCFPLPGSEPELAEEGEPTAIL